MEGEKVVDRQKFVDFLAENALKCPDGMKIISIAGRSQVITVDLTCLINRYGDENVYNNYGEVIGVYYQKEYYALPETKKNINMVQSFVEIKDPNFFFYLNEDEYPKDGYFAEIWQKMTSKGCKEREEEFIQECKWWALNKLKIKPVPNNEIANCLLIPDEGIKVRDMNKEYDDRTYYPLVSYLDSSTITEVGLYSAYDGRTIFVNYDGRTYMAKGTHIVNLLKSLNYKVFSYYLPIRANEEIIDEKLRSAWDSIPEINDPESP